MKKLYIILSFLLVSGYMLYGQSNDPFINNCIMNAGADARYLKDFRIQLGKSSATSELRYKAKMSLWKHTIYRFTMCNTDNSEGQLILSIRNEANRVVVSSFDKETGKIYPSIDFKCNKSGIYHLNYDFINGHEGSGVGVVSMIK